MAYERFSTSGVYVFAGKAGWTCMVCRLTDVSDGWHGDVVASTRQEMVDHLREHEKHGHSTGKAIPRLLREMATQDQSKGEP